MFQTPTFTAGVSLHNVDSDKSTFYLLRCKHYTDTIIVRKEGKMDRYTVGFLQEIICIFALCSPTDALIC